MVDIIKELCRGQNLTISELEQKIGFPQNAIYKWDDHAPNVLRVYEVAKFFGVQIETLIPART